MFSLGVGAQFQGAEPVFRIHEGSLMRLDTVAKVGEAGDA